MVAIQGEHRYFEREERKGVSFALAILVHGLLGVLLLISVQWRTQRPQTIEVEMWSSLPPAQEQIAKPQVAPPRVDEPVAVQPPKVEPAPEIVEEKVKKKPQEKPKAEPQKQDDPLSALSKILSQGVEERNKAVVAPSNKPAAKPNGAGTNPAATVNAGTAPVESAGARVNDEYMGMVVRLIKSNVVYPENKRESPKAKIRVFLLPDGSIQDAKVLKIMGDPAYAEATRRAVMTTQRFPVRPDGKAFSGDAREWVLSFCYDKNLRSCKID